MQTERETPRWVTRLGLPLVVLTLFSLMFWWYTTAFLHEAGLIADAEWALISAGASVALAFHVRLTHVVFDAGLQRWVSTERYEYGGRLALALVLACGLAVGAVTRLVRPGTYTTGVAFWWAFVATLILAGPPVEALGRYMDGEPVLGGEASVEG